MIASENRKMEDGDSPAHLFGRKTANRETHFSGLKKPRDKRAAILIL